MSVVLLTKIVVENKGLVADVTALVCFSVIGTVVPHAAWSVAFTLAAAVSDRKSSEIVEVSKPLTYFRLESPIDVISNSSKTRLIVALVT
jgi:hypothetical protein